MSEQNVIEIVAQAVELAGGQRRLAELIGIEHHSKISRWLTGTKIEASLFKKIEAFVASRSPSTDEARGEPKAFVDVIGRVAAGSVSASVEDRQQVDALTLNWTKSTAWALTRGEVRYLQVWGNSMEPAYPDGSLIACREPRDAASVPKGWPVILQDQTSHEQTFKLFYTTPGQRGPVTVGVPINPAHDLVVFRTGAKVNYLVVGKIEPFVANHTNNHRAPGGLMMREDASE